MRLTQYALTGLTILGLASTVMANGRNPGSLLLFPEFDNRVANLTLVTVTNTNSDMTPVAGNALAGTVKVEFVYIGKYGTAGQVLELPRVQPHRDAHAERHADGHHVVAQPAAWNRAYVYVFAKDRATRAKPRCSTT